MYTVQASLNNSIARRWKFCLRYVTNYTLRSLSTCICLLTKWINNVATPQR